jgi:uncharacterized protein
MRWRGQQGSSNIEDRRGRGGGIALGGGGLGVLVLAAIVCLLGGDPRQLLEGVPQETQVQQPSAANNAPDDQREFASVVLRSTEKVFGQILPQQANMRYREPKLVLFSGRVSSACGMADSATGPFYCPGDSNLYLDFAFFEQLRREFKAPGDFAQAYVIAHEVGHHVQNLTGMMSKVQRAGQNNQLSVALELQADCYAGVWAHYANREGLVEADDPQEALRAAAAVGDDMIQRRTQGVVVPDSFTHGSSQQRMEWFARGYKSGDLRQCDTFR